SVAGLICLAVFMVLRPTPVAAVIDFYDVSFAMEHTQFVAYDEPEPEPVATAPKRTIKRTVARSNASDDVPPASTEAAPSEPGPRAAPDGDDAIAEASIGGGAAAEPQTGALQFGLD